MKTQQALSALDRAVKTIPIYAPQRENEFTAMEFADRMGINNRTALTALNSQVKRGILVMRKGSNNGARTNFYSFV